MDNGVAIRQQIDQALNRVLLDSGRPTKSPADEDRLSDDLGLDSLDLAVLVVQLEQQLGVDPFRSRTGPVATFGDLVRVYEKALDHSS